MNHTRSSHWMIASTLLLFAALACGGTVKQSEPTALITPFLVNRSRLRAAEPVLGWCHGWKNNLPDVSYHGNYAGVS